VIIVFKPYELLSQE